MKRNKKASVYYTGPSSKSAELQRGRQSSLHDLYAGPSDKAFKQLAKQIRFDQASMDHQGVYDACF